MGVHSLFHPLAVGAIAAPNRVFMAPLTRSRAEQPGDVPWALNATYYAQRASAGLIITEATYVSPVGKGYAFVPGMCTDEQEAGWKLVVDAVHEAGGRILLQLWHTGRISHTDLLPAGEAPVAPSAIHASAQTYVSADSGMVDVGAPRALGLEEIPGVVAEFRQAAERAKRAGFDGVEIHGANGYLLDQFTREGSNQRTDSYGGSLENRLRFPLEVTQAVAGVFGADRVGYRISPSGAFNDMADANPIETFATLAAGLSDIGIAFIDVVEAFAGADRADDVAADIRNVFDGIYVANGAYDGESGSERIAAGLADAVTFGTLFIANPDLPRRLSEGTALNDVDPSTFYGGAEKGYTDYPALDPTGV